MKKTPLILLFMFLRLYTYISINLWPHLTFDRYNEKLTHKNMHQRYPLQWMGAVKNTLKLAEPPQMENPVH